MKNSKAAKLGSGRRKFSVWTDRTLFELGEIGLNICKLYVSDKYLSYS